MGLPYEGTYVSLEEDFTAELGRSPEGVWAAPGRVNLIGEHTDYNDGFVLPLAIPQGVLAAAARRDDGVIRLVSRQQDGRVEVPVDKLTPGSPGGWSGYVLGVAWALREAGHDIGGVDLLVHGDVPLGAGLSSSAALECAAAIALVDLYSLDIPRPALAKLAQKAENDYVGMPCGVLDQSASLLCTEDNALFMDTRTLEAEQVPLDLAGAGLTLLVIDTKAPHRHVDGEYAQRRASCEEAARLLGVPALRDISLDDLDTALARLDDAMLRRRVRHVVTENERVLDTVQRLRAGSPRDIGGLLTQSHESLRDDYEVTVDELDTAVEAALAAGALGARMTGGGFGGCIIALVDTELADSVEARVQDAFALKGFSRPVGFVVQPAPGARRLT
ncbi:galactokinase [Flindersiella endophytica]